MESCIECRKIMKLFTKEKTLIIKNKIFKEIQEFIENPDNFYVIINPVTQFYKFKKITK